MEKRNTKQKEKIIEILSRKENHIHPTINEIINLVSKEDKTIGQATIYRQINNLVQDNILKKIPAKDGFHYDIKTDLHSHFICQKCNRLIDLYDSNYQKIINELQNKYSLNIIEANIILYGICEECNDKV